MTLDFATKALSSNRNLGFKTADMATDKILIKRAPVLVLGASILAERLGFDDREAVSLGKAVSGLTAQSKGRRLGIFTPSP